jgi:hypothetical protein
MQGVVSSESDYRLDRAESALRRYLGGNETDIATAREVIGHMRLKTEWLQRDAYAWSLSESPKRFWIAIRRHHLLLAPLASRMVITTADTCPSGRFFTAMRWIRGFRHGRLTSSKSNMLVFLFHNARFLMQIEDNSVATSNVMNTLQTQLWPTVLDEDKEAMDEEYFNDWFRMRVSQDIEL